MFRQTFTRSTPAPDLPSLVTTIRPTVGDPFYVGVQMDNGVFTVAVEKATAWQAGEITTVQNAVNACVAATPQTEAQAWIDAMPLGEKAFALAIIDQLNTLRAFHSLAAITPTAAMAAIRAKAATL